MSENSLIYLHGFNSSPRSHKARVLYDYVAERGEAHRLFVPVLSAEPAKAVETMQRLMDTLCERDRPGVIGSSMGGFYATWLAEKYDVPAVLVNPAVCPHKLLEKYLGPNRNYHTGETYELTQAHIQQLKSLDIEPLQRLQNLLVLLETGDEVLDYRQAAEKYHRAEVRLFEGGNHGFSRFSAMLDKMLDFTGFRR